MAAIRAALFEAVARQLFGDAFVDAHGAAHLEAAAANFEDDFETAASPFPQILQRRFCAARRELLCAFKCARGSDPSSQTV